MANRLMIGTNPRALGTNPRAVGTNPRRRHNIATITEQQFTNSILEWSKAYGWRRFHVRSSGRMNNGRPISTVQGDKGFPDLVLLRPPRLIFAELKVGRNKESPEQMAWLADLLALSLFEVAVYTWRPAQWTEILGILAR